MADGINFLNLGGTSAGLGSAIGTGLSSGLQSLAQIKLQQMQQAKQAQALAPFVGGNQDLANKLMSLPEKERFAILQNLPGQGGLGAGQQQSGLGVLAGQGGNLFQTPLSPYQSQMIQQKERSALAKEEANKLTLSRQQAQSAKLADIYQDPRLANLDPSQISSYTKSPEYTKSRSRKEVSGIIADIKKSIEGGVSGGKFSGFISGLIGGKKSSYDSLVSQLVTSKDPLISSLAAGLKSAPDDKTRRTIFNTFVKNNPESMPQVGQSIDNIQSQYADSEVFQQQAMGSNQPQDIVKDQQQSNLMQEAPERTLGQQTTGVGAELAKSPAGLIDMYKGLTDIVTEGITDPAIKNLRDNLSNAMKSGSEGIKGFINNIAEKISPGSTSEEGIGIGERAFRNVAKSAPLIALSVPFTATGIASSLTANLGGSAVGEYLKDEDFGLGSQLVGNIGTSILLNKGFGALGKAIQEVPKNTPIEKFKSSLYGNATKLGSSTSVGKGIVVKTSQGNSYGITEKIKSFIKKVKDNEYIGANLTEAQQKTLIKNAETLETNLIDKAKKGVRVSLNDVTKELEKINVDYDSSNTLNGKLYREFRGIVSDSLEEAGKTNPEWYKAWKPAQELNAIENWQAPFTKALQEAGLGKSFAEIAAKALVNPFVTSLRLGGKAATAGVAYGVDQLGKNYKYLKFMINNPQGKALAEKLIMAAAQNKGGEIFKTLEAINKFYDKEVNKKQQKMQ